MSLTAPARTLSGGEQQMVVLAQALIGAPRYLLSLGLGPGRGEPADPGDRRGGRIRRGRAADRAVATVALGLANRARIMEGGRIRFSGQASELGDDNPARLRSAYLLRGSTPSDDPERAG